MYEYRVIGTMPDRSGVQQERTRSRDEANRLGDEWYLDGLRAVRIERMTVSGEWETITRF